MSMKSQCPSIWFIQGPWIKWEPIPARIDSTGHEKSNFTVVLSVTAAGEKLRPMIIFKKKRIPKDNFSPEVVVRANDKGWMNHELMRTWLHKVWNKRKCYVNDPSQSLLILDSARCHLTEDVRELFKEHSKITVIPGGMTKYLQPLDVGINKPFKDNLRAGWERWMADPARARYTTGGARKRMTYGEAALVYESFNANTEETTANSFTKALDDEPIIEGMNEDFDALIVADNNDNDGRSSGQVVAMNVCYDEHGMLPE
ncbi:unnamed protein product [Cylicocyclus nassatus]|uniref:DDE-1 domain-containing protein n=1 Tax=Cylicocyclus nassatus TaxID=53992 RepID=A0AA36GX77_CYLNA|nr:unnamed protein product [Cylicocyclus nassatus]